MLGDEATRITLSLALAAETRSLFSVTLPTVAEIQHEPKAYDVDTIRQGEVTGALFALGAGVVVSMIARDPLPLLVTGIMTGGMIATYEHAIARPGNPATDLNA